MEALQKSWIIPGQVSVRPGKCLSLRGYCVRRYPFRGGIRDASPVPLKPGLRPLPVRETLPSRPPLLFPASPRKAASGLRSGSAGGLPRSIQSRRGSGRRRFPPDSAFPATWFLSPPCRRDSGETAFLRPRPADAFAWQDPGRGKPCPAAARTCLAKHPPVTAPSRR